MTIPTIPSPPPPTAIGPPGRLTPPRPRTSSTCDGSSRAVLRNRTIQRGTSHGALGLRQRGAQCARAPVAQWIEQRFPKPRALVRFRAGASVSQSGKRTMCASCPIARGIRSYGGRSRGPWRVGVTCLLSWRDAARMGVLRDRRRRRWRDHRAGGHRSLAVATRVARRAHRLLAAGHVRGGGRSDGRSSSTRRRFATSSPRPRDPRNMEWLRRDRCFGAPLARWLEALPGVAQLKYSLRVRIALLGALKWRRLSKRAASGTAPETLARADILGDRPPGAMRGKR